jgi:hypothetical protein
LKELEIELGMFRLAFGEKPLQAILCPILANFFINVDFAKL